MTFSKINLSGARALIKGTDQFGVQGETVVDTQEWDALKLRSQVARAHEEFDAAVEDFFAPLIEATEKLNLEHDNRRQDEASFVVIDEGEEATPGRRRNVVTLSKDSIVLRLIEEGNSARLVWVNGELEVLEVLPGTSGVTNGATGNGDPHADENVVVDHEQNAEAHGNEG